MRFILNFFTQNQGVFIKYLKSEKKSNFAG